MSALLKKRGSASQVLRRPLGSFLRHSLESAPSRTRPGERSLELKQIVFHNLILVRPSQIKCAVFDVTLGHLGIICQIKRILFLLRFCRFPADDPQKVKMTRILEELINLTVKEKGVGSVPW